MSLANPSSRRYNALLALGVILLFGLALRFCVARYLANDDPDDGRAYALLATNMLDHTVFSDDVESPYEPTIVRVPGYPIFLATIYAFAGHGNNTAVRIVQAVIDTLSCGLIAVLAYLWMPDERRKIRAALIAAGFAVVCPFTAIYVATILTEVLTTFLMLALAVTATLALKSRSKRRAVELWIASGVIAALSALVRPDAGIFAAAAGLTMVIVVLFLRERDAAGRAKPFTRRLVQTLMFGTFFSVAFLLVLVPWTIRNKRVFGVFQPLAPAHAEAPGEFVPHGYYRWLRTWVDDEKYIEPAIWALGDQPIEVDDLPDKAFDSPEEKARVEALLDQYNHPPPSADDDDDDTPDAAPDSGPKTLPVPETSPTPGASPANSPAPSRAPSQALAPAPKANANIPAKNGNANSANANTGNGDNANSNDDDSKDDAYGGDDSTGDDKDDDSADDQQTPGAVEMTPAVDAGFAQIAQERISRNRLRYYVWMPVKRMFALWFGTHSQYYPFAGELFPWSDLDHDEHQQIWLPLFALIVALYTIVGKAGGWVLVFWRREGRQWAVLVSLMTLPRLIFFSTIENPEPRYVVELFAFVSVLAGIALAWLSAG